MTDLPVAIIGAGPVGLAAAVHLLDRGETPLVLEQGEAPGHAISRWQHVRMFSPWGFNTDRAAVRRLEEAGWRHPAAETMPTGGEYVSEYLTPLANLPSLRPHVALNARVMAVGRRGYDKVMTENRSLQPFVLRVRQGGATRTFQAKAVIDASGTWFSPNPIGAGGLPASGEIEAIDRIHHGIPDVLGAARSRFAGRTVLVVGSGHSAINVLIDLGVLRRSVPGTTILWALRRSDVTSAYGGGSADQLPARGALGLRARDLVETGAVTAIAPFRIDAVTGQPDGRLLVHGEGDGRDVSIETDEIVGATGFRPDFSFLREIRLSTDPWLESAGTIGPLIDPNLHSCGTVRPHGAAELRHPETNFYIAGMKSYGRAPTFLAATGHEQVRSIVAAITGDSEAAARVELVLPETGVCSAPPAIVSGDAAACCVPAPTSPCCRPASAA